MAYVGFRITVDVNKTLFKYVIDAGLNQWRACVYTVLEALHLSVALRVDLCVLLNG